MTVAPLAPGTVRRAFDEALARLEAEGLRFDEDLIGVPLPEPLAGNRPGVMVAVFLLGRGEGGQVVYPPRAFAQIGLSDGTITVNRLQVPNAPHPRPLGLLIDALPILARERAQRLNSLLATLDTVAPTVALRQGIDPGVRDDVARLFHELAAPVLRPIYRQLAPRFHAWLAQ